MLRDLHVDPHLVDVRDAEQFRPIAAAGSTPGIDESADVGFPRGDDAVKGRRDLLVIFHCLQAIDVALVGRHLRLGGVQPGDGGIVVSLLAFLLLGGDDAFR